MNGGGVEQRHGRAGGKEAATGKKPVTEVGVKALDKYTVDMDRERANFTDNAIRYESTLRFINGHVRTMVSAITGQ